MSERRKITVRVPAELFAACQAYTGASAAETLRLALANLVEIAARERASSLADTGTNAEPPGR